MNNDAKPPSPEGLETRIKHARRQANSEGKQVESNLSTAFAVGTDLVAGVAVGTFIGYYLDKWLNTTPLFFLICFFLGAIAGGYNIYRSVQKDSIENDKQ